MFWYYLSRSSLVTFLLILVWSIGNIFVNIPPDFNIYKGDIIHKEIVKKEECKAHHDCTKYFLDITYITKSGHTVELKNADYCDESYNIKNILEKNKYYETNGTYVTIFVLISAFSLIGFLLTVLGDGLDDIDQMLYGDQATMINARNMRFNHYKLICNFWGYPDDETRKLTYEAIELVRNDPHYLQSVQNGYTIHVPTMTDIEEKVDETIKKLIKEKQQKETNIANG